MITVITAPHGGGKTAYITELIDVSHAAIGKTLFLVPEQHHFMTERRLYKELGAKNIAKINVTSFTKLSKEILGFYNQKKPYADEAVKEITMQKVLRNLKLRHYNSEHSKASRLINIIAEFQKGGVSPAEILDAAEKAGGKTGAKLSELANIYDMYTETLIRIFNDKTDDVRNAAALCRIYEYFSGAKIFIDAFDGFTGSQMLMLDAMAACGDLTVTVPFIKAKGYEYNERLLSKLKLSAQKTGTAFKKIELPAIKSSERKPQKISLITAPDVYTECDFVAAKIRELITKEGYRLSDIAVLSSVKTSLPVLGASFDVYGISAFSDIPEPVIEKPLIRFIINILDAVSFESEALAQYIKSGFVRVSGVLLSRFELNALERAQEEWQMVPDDWKNPFPEANKQLFELETLRSGIIKPLTDLSDKLSNSAGDKMTEIFADFLINTLEIPRTISGIINRGTGRFEKGFEIDPELNEEYRQLWDTVIGVLESMHAALRDYPISIADYRDILYSVFTGLTTARPPQVLDAVTIGDTERTHMSDIKILFIIGANSGVFPRSIKSEGEFSSDEAERLAKIGLEIYDDRKGRYFKERYIVHKALHAASERLYISAPVTDISAKAVEISPLFSELERKYNIKTSRTADFPLSFWVSTKKAAKMFYARRIADNAEQEKLAGLLKNVGESEYALRLIDLQNSIFAKDKYRYKILDENAEKLMCVKTFSPSAITMLFSCKYKYFLTYGLRLKTPQIQNNGELNPIQRGNLIHYCLESILKEYRGRYDDFLNLSENETEAAVRKKTEQFLNDKIFMGLTPIKRQKGAVEILIPRIKRIMLQIQKDMQVTKFKPLEFEKRLGFNLGEIRIEGVADRVDVLEKSGKKYINIIDYKSGSSSFDFSLLYYGLGWQTLLYMYSAAEENSAFIPASALYQSQGLGKLSAFAETPTNRDLIPDSKAAAENWLTNHRMKGVHFLNSENSDGYDDLSALSDSYQTASGSKADFIKTVNISAEQNNKLMEHFKKLMSKALDDILSGRVEAVPIMEGSVLPCQYCEFKKLCGNKGRGEITEADKTAINTLFN